MQVELGDSESEKLKIFSPVITCKNAYFDILERLKYLSKPVFINQEDPKVLKYSFVNQVSIKKKQEVHDEFVAFICDKVVHVPVDSGPDVAIQLHSYGNVCIISIADRRNGEVKLQ